MDKKDFFVHESTYIDEGVCIGPGTRIWHFCHVMSGCEIGAKCNIGQNVYIGSGVKLGKGVKIQNNVSLYSGVICEDDVFLGPSMVFTNVINPRAFIERKTEFRPTIIKKGATIGANATVVCGHTIGCYAFIGAGAVVTSNVPDYALVYGNPGKIRGWVCQCGSKLEFKESDAQCPACNKRFSLLNECKIEAV